MMYSSFADLFHWDLEQVNKLTLLQITNLSQSTKELMEEKEKRYAGIKENKTRIPLSEYKRMNNGI